MADIELVIKIPNKVYKAICNKNALGCDIDDIKNIIRNGTPLPKGHGRLIDADALQEDCLWWETENEVSSAPTVIEADKEKSDLWEKWLYPNRKENKQ